MLPPQTTQNNNQRKFRAVLGALTLSVRTTERDDVFKVRVTKRIPGAGSFQHSLVIKPGTVLRFKDGYSIITRHFVPTIRYGHLTSSGTIFT